MPLKMAFAVITKNQLINNLTIKLMNKILRYSLSLVLALVASVTFASEPYKVLTFPDEGTGGQKINTYNKTWKATIGEDTWTIENFNTNQNNWAYIKCGSKKFASVATITSPAIDKAVGNVLVTIDNITAASVNSISLKVATDADFENVTEEIKASEIKAGDMIFKTTKAVANCYYKVVFDCAQGTANGLVQVSKVAYYKEGDSPVVVDITNTPETAYTVAKAIELIAANEGLATKVYVKGKIASINEVSTEHGNATYDISDDGTTSTTLTVYRGYYIGGEKFTAEDQIKVGDEVIVYGKLVNYKGANEINSGNKIYSLNGSTTGIHNISAEEANADAPVYNLAGQRVGKNAKGVLIKNGKKYVVK